MMSTENSNVNDVLKTINIGGITLEQLLKSVYDQTNEDNKTIDKLIKDIKKKITDGNVISLKSSIQALVQTKRNSTDNLLKIAQIMAGIATSQITPEDVSDDFNDETRRKLLEEIPSPLKRDYLKNE